MGLTWVQVRTQIEYRMSAPNSSRKILSFTRSARAKCAFLEPRRDDLAFLARTISMTVGTVVLDNYIYYKYYWSSCIQ